MVWAGSPALALASVFDQRISGLRVLCLASCVGEGDSFVPLTMGFCKGFWDPVKFYEWSSLCFKSGIASLGSACFG